MCHYPLHLPETARDSCAFVDVEILCKEHADNSNFGNCVHEDSSPLSLLTCRVAEINQKTPLTYDFQTSHLIALRPCQ